MAVPSDRTVDPHSHTSRAPERVPERRHTPHAVRGTYFGAVREAWQRARAAHEAEHPALRLALAVFARDGRARGVPVEALLRALDTIVRPHAGGDAALDFGRAREAAGALLIRAYYAD
jgi:hypothetical protein